MASHGDPFRNFLFFDLFFKSRAPGAGARRGFFRAQNSDFLFFEHIKERYLLFQHKKIGLRLSQGLTLPPKPPGYDLGGLRHDF